MSGRKHVPLTVEQSTTSITGLSGTPVAMHLWKDALEITEADRCFNVSSSVSDNYKDLVELENLLPKETNSRECP